MKLDSIRELFAKNFQESGELGASLSVWRDGEEVLALADGWCDREKTRAWTESTPVLFWSATKGLASACLLHVLQEHRLDLSLRVRDLWNEFAEGGKDALTIGEVMSHRAGLSALSEEVAVTDYDAVIRALAAQPPLWPIGEGHGYHPRTFGFLVDELVRRITGLPIGTYWRTQFAEPLGLDAWIGAPSDVLQRTAPVFPARTTVPKGDPFYRAFSTPGSLTARSFASPRGLHSVAAMNEPATLMQSFPAFGGVGTARALGKFYAMLASGGEWDGRRYFQPRTLGWMTTTLTQGVDRVLLLETAFSAGFMRDPVDASGKKVRAIFGPSLSAFGQPGAGGSHAFADPENRISFAYVMNQMEPGVLPGPKSLRLIEALYR